MSLENGKNKQIIIRQLDKKLNLLRPMELSAPTEGWIKTIRTALNMSLNQLGKRLHITVPGIRAMEIREKQGGITLNSLKEIAEALNMKLVYGFVPKESLEKMVEQKAYEVATKIVKRTSISMKLEDQENTPERINEAIQEMANEISKEVPKYLWD
jgi:predicted DNA-binding mobile mystery protein A